MVWTYQPSFIEIAIVLTEIGILNTDNKGRKRKKNIFFFEIFFSTTSTTHRQAGRRTWVVDYPIEPDAMGPFDGEWPED